MEEIEEKDYIRDRYEVISCPFCGESHKVLNLISALSFVGEYWSDRKLVMPDCPKIFPIHKCSHCGRYYFIRPEQEHDVDIDAEVHTLDYQQLKEARKFFENFLLTDCQQNWLMVQLFFGYNDEFRRSDNSPEPTAEDEAIFREATDWLLNMEDVSEPLLWQAEIYRQRGDFNKAMELLWDFPDDEPNKWVANAIFEHARTHDRRPFLLMKDHIKVT